ncbi:MAG: NADAR family protein [Hyphomicrobiales bacterium]|nr:NADAR family protein [Hyphomicrobiales bacterium]
MQVRLKSDVLVLVPETDDEAAALSAWKAAREGFVFALTADAGPGAGCVALGPRNQACREPINVHSENPDPRIAIIANFAPTPFLLDGERYACVEAFWQSLRFPHEERPRIAALDGAAAKRASEQQPYGSHVHYGGEAIAVGTHRHWRLMRRACEAKFVQNADARDALLATAERPLIHRVRHDSVTIPGVIMADIWMALRAQLRGTSSPLRATGPA